MEGGGVTLSSGLRHSVALVRALVRDPQVIILDETTSKVDTDVWHAVSERLEYHMYPPHDCSCALSGIFPSGAVGLQGCLSYSSKFTDKYGAAEPVSLKHLQMSINTQGPGLSHINIVKKYIILTLASAVLYCQYYWKWRCLVLIDVIVQD